MNNVLNIAAARLAVASVRADAGLPAPTVNWSFLGVTFALSIYNGLYTIVLVLAGIAFLVGVVLIIFGRVGHHQSAFSGGLWTVGSAIFGAVLATGVAGLINWGSGQHLTAV